MPLHPAPHPGLNLDASVKLISRLKPVAVLADYAHYTCLLNHLKPLFVMLCNLIWPNLRTSALALSAQTSIGDHFKVKQQPTRTFIISGRGSIKISWKVGKMWRPETPPPRKTQSPSLHFNNIKKWQNAQKILRKSLCPKDSIFLWLSSILHTRSSSWFWCPWPGLEFA